MADKNIKITIRDRRAILEGSPVIVCGNSGYTVTFSFDDEWNLTGTRTARFVYVKDGEVKHEDKVFSGDVVAVPILSNVAFVKVGVFAGDLCTTTPARINCELSILCGSGKIEEPTPDVYNQIMALFNEMAEKGAFGATEEQMQRVAANEEAIRALKTGAVLAGDAEKLGGQLPAYYATAQSVKDLVSGTTPAGKAGDADTVGGKHAKDFMLNSLGECTDADLLTWLKNQTVGGYFTVNPAVTTSGCPVNGAWFYGFLGVGKGTHSVIIFRSYHSGVGFKDEMYFNTTSSGTWRGWNKGDADTVNGFTVYKNLSELGLTEATATPKAIAEAMADNSMLTYAMSGTANTSALATPFVWVMLRVHKVNNAYVMFECQNSAQTPILQLARGYYNGNNAASPWSGWHKVADADLFLPLTGGTLIGILKLGSGYARVGADQNHANLFSFNSATSETDGRGLAIMNSAYKTDVADALIFRDKANNALKDYTVLHTGNSQKVTITSGKDVPPSTMEGLWAY